MKKKPLNRFDMKRIFAMMLDTCLTKKSSAFFIAVATLLVAACSPKTSNYYNTQNGTEQNHTGNTVNSGANGVGNGGGSTGDGGGGQGVLCGNTKDPKIRNQLFVRDIYEAIYNHNRSLKSVSNSGESIQGVSDEALVTLVSSIQQVYGPASPNLEFTKKKYWSEFVKKISFLDQTRQLYTSKDANSPIALPPECELVQIAYWDESSGDENGTLYVSKPLWDKLDQLNKIGLLAHEFFFKKARLAGYKNSDMVRFKIGQLLSTSTIPPMFPNWEVSPIPEMPYYLPKNTKAFSFCSGTSREDASAKLQFYQYEGSDNNKHLVIPTLESKTINFKVFQSGHFTLGSEGTGYWFQNFLLASILRSYSRQSLEDDEVEYNSTLDIPSHKLNITGLDYARWMVDGTGLSAPKSKQDIRNIFPQALVKSSMLQPYFWSGKTEMPGEPITFELLNPSYDSRAVDTTQYKFKNPQQLMQTLNARIKTIILSCKDINIPGDIYTSNVAQLNSEIASAVKLGTYPNLQKWKSFIASLSKFALYKESSSDKNLEKDGHQNQQEVACSFVENNELNEQIPFYLYSIKSLNYSEQDIFQAIGTDAYVFEEVAKPAYNDNLLHPLKIDTKMAVKQGINSVVFDLNCYDSLSTYFRNEISNKFQSATPPPNEKLSVKYVNHPDQKDSQRTVEKIQLLADSLSAILASSQPEHFFRLCDPKNVYKDPFSSHCADYKLLVAELKSEQNIEIKSCRTAGYTDDNKNIFCAALTLKLSKHSYIVRYQENPLGNDLPTIKFVRLIPPF